MEITDGMEMYLAGDIKSEWISMIKYLANS